MTQKALTKRIEEYLSAGGLFNPELANHVAVRDLLIECREALREHAMREVQRLGQEIEQEPVAYWKEHAQGLQRDYDSLLADFQAQLEERNFCPRCGKRTKEIHTCTPPQENT